MTDGDTYKDMTYFDDAALGPSINFVAYNKTDDKFYHYKYYVDSEVCIKHKEDKDDYSVDVMYEKRAKKIVSNYLESEYNTTIEKVTEWVKNNVRKKLEEAHDAFDVFFIICGTEPLEKEHVVLKDDDITYLSCVLAVMMASMKAYNLNPEEEFFFNGGESMEDAFINKMRDIGIGEATIGAIIAECGGCYSYKYNESEEDEDIIALFTPDAIKKRLEKHDEE